MDSEPNQVVVHSMADKIQTRLGIQNHSSTQLAWICAFVVSVAAAAFYISISDWPFGTHPDEIKKVNFILSGKQDFFHPLLLLQLARFANSFLGYTDPENVVGLGRTISGIFGGLLVLSTFVLGRLVLAPFTAVAAAVAVAGTPLVAMHATFLKEDIYFSAPSILGLAAIVAFVKHPSWKLAVAVGAAFGIALSAKYVAALLMIWAIFAMMIGPTCKFVERLKYAGIAVSVAALILITINAPALFDIPALLEGLRFEVEHAKIGHDVILPISLTGGTMHLRVSLLPGLGLPLLTLGILGLTAPLLYKTQRKSLAIIAGTALLWYVAHEVSPLKPYPNIERYMLLEAPLLVILGATLVERIVSMRLPRLSTVAACGVILAFAAPAAYALHEIVSSNAHDPRRIVPQLVSALGPQTFFDDYVIFNEYAHAAAGNDPSRRTVFFVTSSFVYERFAEHGDDPIQSSRTRGHYDLFFNKIFPGLYLEIASGGPSFGFVNPTIRIVSMDNNVDRLLAIREKVIEADPNLKIDISPRR